MDKMLKILAHSGESHENSFEKFAHEYTPGFLAVPAYLLALAMIGYIVWIVSGKKTDAVLIVLAVINLICGFTFYAISPLVSVIAITMGLVMSGMLTFGGISNDTKKK